ncbi:hypothetical protein PC120_g28142 [Phytophthora cactorum]|nr:hypothetical protein PC120_g28142 [Phytophthora cactorum]
MRKQYTVYRVPFRDTGNDTEVPLSDPRAMRERRIVQRMERISAITKKTVGSVVDKSLDESGQSTSGWRQYSGKRNREKTETAEGMRSIGTG